MILKLNWYKKRRMSGAHKAVLAPAVMAVGMRIVYIFDYNGQQRQNSVIGISKLCNMFLVFIKNNTSFILKNSFKFDIIVLRFGLAWPQTGGLSYLFIFIVGLGFVCFLFCRILDSVLADITVFGVHGFFLISPSEWWCAQAVFFFFCPPFRLFAFCTMLHTLFCTRYALEVACPFLIYLCRGDLMKLCYKIDVLAALKERGYSTYRIRKENLLSQSTIQKFRKGEGVGWKILKPSVICCLASPRTLLRCSNFSSLHYEPDWCMVFYKNPKEDIEVELI